ncbi:MAG: cobalt transporter CbiM [Helicobacteraceae bacterium]|jgi:cobalt/nickel transport system permease protein|nr:cobalt transporter CbiM [Helicobacteraceae bacterium]
MHIADGALRPEILTIGYVAGASALVASFAALKNEEIPKTAACSALFFVASFIHIPIGVTSAHLILNGIIGALIGFRAFAAIGAALIMQTLLFGYGGVSSYGVNVCVLALPAMIGYAINAIVSKTATRDRAAFFWRKRIAWFSIGFFPIIFGAFLLSTVLALSGEGFISAAKLAFLAHLPLSAIEGIITLFALEFIERVKPSLIAKQ